MSPLAPRSHCQEVLVQSCTNVTVARRPENAQRDRNVDALRPGALFDRLLQILGRSADIHRRRIQRVMPHKLRQPMQGHGLGEHVAEAVPQIMWTEIGHLWVSPIFIRIYPLRNPDRIRRLASVLATASGAQDLAEQSSDRPHRRSGDPTVD